MSIGDNNTEGVEAPAAEQMEDTESDLDECTACSSKLPDKELIELRCEDKYCRTCLEKIFEAATKDETQYPPSCCGVTITTKLVQSHLSKSLLRRFKMKQPEFSTRNRTYCHKPRCSAFIAPHSIHNGQAICQKCRSVTCSKCRNAWHFGACVEGEDAALFKLMRSTKWKQCPECRRAVSKSTGCNHIVCRCGAEWCYGCAEKTYRCECREESDVDDNGSDEDSEDEGL